MDEIIWYCTDDNTIYPDEAEAKKAYYEWCEANYSEYDEKIFKDCYRPITFQNYNYNLEME